MRRIELSNIKNKKIALVLSGGVVKAAAWHLGVSLALEELGFTLKNNNSKKSSLDIGTYVGSSAGALICLYFANGFKPHEIIDANLKKSERLLKPISYKEVLSFKKYKYKTPKSNMHNPFKEFPFFIRTILSPFLKIKGLFTTQGLKDYLEEYILLGTSFDDYLADLFIVATQLDHSRKVIFSKYKYPSSLHDSTSMFYTGIPVADAAAASMSVPPFYCPYPVSNPYKKQVDYYIDGEIRETLSTDVAVQHKCDVIISSWTHSPYHYHDEIGSLVNYGLPAICTQAIYLMIQKKIISDREQRSRSKDLINTVYEYMKNQKFDIKFRNEIINILQRKLAYNPNVHLIDIYPRHKNYDLFFKSPFSLNPKVLSKVVTLGYKRAIDTFRNHEWER